MIVRLLGLRGDLRCRLLLKLAEDGFQRLWHLLIDAANPFDEEHRRTHLLRGDKPRDGAPVTRLHLEVPDHFSDCLLPGFLDLPCDELLEIVAFLVALECRVEVALLRQALNGAQLPRFNAGARGKKAVGPHVHTVFGPAA